VLWFKLPETAVMVAVYVPVGVPGVVVVCEEEDDPLPPQPIADTPAKAMTAIAISHGRFRFHGSSVPSKIAVHATGAPPKGGRDREVVDAAVVIVAVTVTAAPLSCTAEFDKLHVGTGVAVGVMLQLRFTVPVKLPAGATAIPNCAFCPAAIVCEPCDPEANPTVKSGAATPMPDSATVCGPPPLCATVIFPVAFPAAVGEKVTEI